jgi:diguanylate cyclase (GGDEF)-like protein
VVYFDVDAFKVINDAYGHAVGDQVLREFSEVLRAHSRRDDIPCRTGGEEFCVVLPRTSREVARHVADRTSCAPSARGVTASCSASPPAADRPHHQAAAALPE